MDIRICVGMYVYAYVGDTMSITGDTKPVRRQAAAQYS